jgi:hypothetical protein
MGQKLEGWALRAAWDDFKLGLNHGKEFTKGAIVGNQPWEKTLSKMAGWFVSGDVKYLEKYPEAIKWLQDES